MVLRRRPVLEATNVIATLAMVVTFLASLAQVAAPVALLHGAAAGIEAARSKPDALLDRQVRVDDVHAETRRVRGADGAAPPVRQASLAPLVVVRSFDERGVVPRLAPRGWLTPDACTRARAHLMVFLN